MDIYEIFFIIQFFIAIGILFYKLYNVFSACKAYELKVSWILFIGYFITWFLAFVVFVVNPLIKIYQILYNLETWLILFNVILLIIELFFYMYNTTDLNPKEAYNAKSIYK